MKKLALGFFQNAYAHHSQRHEKFHLGWTFDLAIVATLLIAMMGYFAA